MTRSYSFDKQAALDANSGGKRIKDAGAYLGKFKYAWGETNQNGTESVQLHFVADNGQEAGPLALYTFNQKGEKLPAYNTLNAIMTVLRVPNLTPVKAQVELYDFDSRSMVSKTKDTFQQLMGKPIGLVLQREEYQGQSGLKECLIVVGCYEAATSYMADEIINKVALPVALDRMKRWLEAHPVKALKNVAARRQAESAGAELAPDDEIPF